MSTRYADQSLAAGTTYRYRVFALNGSLTSDPSNEAEATTLTDPQPPNAPSGLRRRPRRRRAIDLSWTDNSTDETQFSIERCQGARCSNFAQVTTVGAGITTYADQSLTASTTYRYQVRALNGSLASDPSNVAQATTQADQQPPPVDARGRHDRLVGANGKSGWRATVTITMRDATRRTDQQRDGLGTVEQWRVGHRLVPDGQQRIVQRDVREARERHIVGDVHGHQRDARDGHLRLRRRTSSVVIVPEIDSRDRRGAASALHLSPLPVVIRAILLNPRRLDILSAWSCP